MTQDHELPVIGDVIVTIRNPGMADEFLVVDRADPWTLATAEMVDGWRSDMPSHVTHVSNEAGEWVTFGTEGEGVGVVTYKIEQAPIGWQPTHYSLTRVDRPFGEEATDR